MCSTSAGGSRRAAICFVLARAESPHLPHGNDSFMPMCSGLANALRHASNVTERCLDPPVAFPLKGTSSDRPTVGSCTVDAYPHAPHVTSDLSTPANAACMGHRHSSTSTAPPPLPNARGLTGPFDPGGGVAGFCPGASRKLPAPPRSLVVRLVCTAATRDRKNSCASCCLCFARCSGDCIHQLCKKLLGTSGSELPEYAPATISSSSHARQCSSSGEGSRPALTASATATSRFAVHSSLTCPSLRKNPPTVGALTTACSTVDRKHVLPRLAMPRRPRGTPCELTLASGAAPFPTTSILDISLVGGFLRFFAVVAAATPASEALTPIAIARVPSTRRSNSGEYVYLAHAAQYSSARSTSANMECGLTAKERAAALMCAAASSRVQIIVQPRQARVASAAVRTAWPG